MKRDRLTRLGVAVVAVEAVVAASVVFVLLGTVFGAEPSPLPTRVEEALLDLVSAPTSTAAQSERESVEATALPAEATPMDEPDVSAEEGAHEPGTDQRQAGGADSAAVQEEPRLGSAGGGQAELSAPAGPVSHLVQAGENLFRISLAYGVSVESIMSANGLSDPRLIHAGQLLAIPVAEAIAPPAIPLAPVQAATEAGPAASSPDTTAPLPQAQETPFVADEPAPPPAEPTTQLVDAEPTAQLVDGAVAVPTAEPPPPVDLASLPPLPPAVNGVPNDAIVVLPAAVVAHIRDIYARGQALGQNPRAFSKVGDSTIENPFFLARFDGGPYNLGDYAALQPTIDYYAGSFGRQGIAVRRGFHSWTVTDPMWADKSVCLANESPVACEIRLQRPSILLIRLGSNDVGVPDYFESNMRQVVELAIERGVIPVLGTKADRHEGGPNINNEILRRIAADYQIPLWDFDLVAATIPGRGLDSDAVHLTTFYAHDYTSPDAFRRGHSVHNLTALITLDAIWKALEADS